MALAYSNSPSNSEHSSVFEDCSNFLGSFENSLRMRSTCSQACIPREGTSDGAPEAVRQAVGGGCQSG